jgi:hypothetical protein
MPTVTRSAHKAPAKPHKPKFPIRKPNLVEAASASNVVRLPPGVSHIPDDAVIYPEWVGWTIRGAKYPAAFLLFGIALGAGFYLHRTLALAEVGELTCSDKSSLAWVKPTPDSDVPVLNDAVMLQCAKAYRPFE